MSLLDIFTGGASGDAERAAMRGEQAISNVNVPTTQMLTLPQLQQYVQAGLMTAEQAQSYLQNSNAYDSENVDQTGTSAMVQALNQLSDVSNSGANGTPMEQAQIGAATDQANQQTAGQRGAIEQQMQARGTPGALVQAALMNQYQGQDASQAHRDSLQAQAQAYQQAVQAMSDKGQLGGQLQGQQNTQANTVAGATNAMQQFNAANQQQNSQFNAANRQASNLVNTANTQDVSNKNVSSGNERTAYNTQVPQTVFNDQLAKATGQANAAGKTSDVLTGQGQQNAGIYSGLLGAGAGLAGDYFTGTQKKTAAHGAILGHAGCYHDGGICMDDGGMVPGQAKVPGDSLDNDTVHVMASPGEAVIPRTSVERNLPQVLDLISAGQDQGGGDVSHGTMTDPMDVATILQALRAIRMGAV